jgi:ADP-heptose:LPS heptosyltransferase
MMSKPSPNIGKNLIIHSGGIGDLLLALPAMRFFQHAFRQSPPSLMGHSERLALVAYDLKAETIHSVDRAGMAYFYLEDAFLPSSLRSFFSSFGLVLAFTGKDGPIFSKNVEKAGAARVLALPSFPPEGQKVHVSDYLVELLRKKGIEGEVPDHSLQVSEEALNFSWDYWARTGLKENERVLAIHPGSGNPAKNWSPSHFAGVADWAAGWARVLLISGPARDGVEEVKRNLKKVTPLIAENLSLLQLAAILRRCTAYLGNDSGITHLASSLGLATVALFGPTDPEVWGPRGASVRIMFGKRAESPFFSYPQSHRYSPSPVNFEPDEVIAVLAPLLGRVSPPDPAR